MLGYSHYWMRKHKLPKKDYLLFVEDCKKIIAASNVSIKGPNGEGEPELTDTMVHFNGDKSLEEDHESFYFPIETELGNWSQTDKKGNEFHWTKTSREPYDKVVIACLFAAKLRFGKKVWIHSDGDKEGLLFGNILAEKALGHIFELVISQILVDLDKEFPETYFHQPTGEQNG